MNILLQGVEAYVTRFFAEHSRPELVYHNLIHTQEVVKATEQLSHHYQLSEMDHMAVITAAWFHDVGYLIGPSDGHEGASIDVATTFLSESGIPALIVGRVRDCILATKMPQSPTNLLEEILCDADLFHLGADDYRDKQKRLRKEKENLSGVDIRGRDWREQNIVLLTRHRYFTDYAQVLLQKGQAKNLQTLREKQAEKNENVLAEEGPISILPPLTDHQPEPVNKKSKKKDKENRPERGIETMFRTTSTNQLRLSEIADSKANIMISVNAIMVSVIVSVIPTRIEHNHDLILPTGLFLITSLLTIILAILSTRPNVTQGTFTREDIERKQGNLLFFGNFHQMSLADYEWGIGELMNDTGYLYRTMTRDIYFLGRVLNKKFNLLRLAYNTFMIGFVMSVLAFLIVFFFFSK
ncbi:Pycsar system effector family protein [Spirosoma sp. SC4-14]|uniref:Pycsar system effector family protein n=1 Tax=Spirosoma sp. SC4-14 TaxID=3128900 RepID=UPI0030CE40F2